MNNIVICDHAKKSGDCTESPQCPHSENHIKDDGCTVDKCFQFTPDGLSVIDIECVPVENK